jgi:hypothetical protein
MSPNVWKNISIACAMSPALIQESHAEATPFLLKVLKLS